MGEAKYQIKKDTVVWSWGRKLTILEVNKSALINDYENIIAYMEESEQNELWANKFGL